MTGRKGRVLESELEVVLRDKARGFAAAEGTRDEAQCWRALRASALNYAEHMRGIDLDAAGAALGRKGGAVKSAAKSAAARANGARGGRPTVSSHCETCGAEVARGEACTLHPKAEVATVTTPSGRSVYRCEGCERILDFGQKYCGGAVCLERHAAK
jgi:hypothetical protein